MTKSARNKTREMMVVKETKKAPKMVKGQTKAAKYVGNLLVLHKLQGTLLGWLRKEV